MITLVINSIRNDILSQSSAGQSLALSAVANIGGSEFSEALTQDVQKFVQPLNRERPAHLIAAGIEFGAHMANQKLTIKKACLCLLRLFRNSPENIDLEDWGARMYAVLQSHDLGIQISAMSLLISFVSHNPSMFQACVPVVAEILHAIAVDRILPEDYKYYKVACPWLQVKCLKFLQYYHLPADRTTRDLVIESLSKLLVKSETTDGNNKLNAENAILFEAVNLIISYGSDLDPMLSEQALGLIGTYIGLKDANIRFLGLCAMATLVRLNGPGVVQEHLSTVIDACKDNDVSVGKKALDLLFVMTHESNVLEVVSELLVMLTTVDESLKEEIVVKTAIIAEKYGTSMSWYVDTLVQVVVSAGDFVSEDVWFRVVQVVTNNRDVQEYASAKVLAAVQSKKAQETTVTLAGYILGEFGVSISEQPASSGYDQFSALHQHFGKVNAKVQALLLTAYAKMMYLYLDCKPAIEEVFQKCSTSTLLEIQQRACEYLTLASLKPEVAEVVLDRMPAYAEDKESLLMSHLGRGTKQATDRAWQHSDKPNEEEGAKLRRYSRGATQQENKVVRVHICSARVFVA
jgi:AP-2 complex subunit alpha